MRKIVIEFDSDNVKLDTGSCNAGDMLFAAKLLEGKVNGIINKQGLEQTIKDNMHLVMKYINEYAQQEGIQAEGKIGYICDTCSKEITNVDEMVRAISLTEDNRTLHFHKGDCFNEWTTKKPKDIRLCDSCCKEITDEYEHSMVICDEDGQRKYFHDSHCYHQWHGNKNKEKEQA